MATLIGIGRAARRTRTLVEITHPRRAPRCFFPPGESADVGRFASLGFHPL